MLKKTIICSAGLTVYAMLSTYGALAADASNMLATAATWEKAFNAGDLKAIVALYAADGCRMPPNETMATGSDAILANLKEAKDHGVAKIKIAVTMSETGGSVGHAMGTYELTDAAGKTLEHGKWMNASTKTSAGWKVQCDIWNADASAPMPTDKAN